MIETFLATLTPMLTLFTCIAIGYALRRTKIVGDEAGKVIAKLETYVFNVVISFSSMSKNFTIVNIGKYWTNILFGLFVVLLAIGIAALLAKVFVKEDNYERKIYSYALAFANYGYVGDPIVMMLFGGMTSMGFFYYKMITLPIGLLCLSIGVSGLIPGGNSRKDTVKRLLNPPMLGLLAGMVVGIAGLGKVIYSAPQCAFIVEVLDMLGACMGPCAMLLAGITVARFSFIAMIKKKKVYVASIFRLIILPAVILAIVYAGKELINLIFGANINNDVFFLLFFAVAMPLGMNTIVYPEAYGGDPSTGASMTLISHTLCVITIPIMYALLGLIFGALPVF